jgi:hypothetical protein
MRPHPFIGSKIPVLENMNSEYCIDRIHVILSASLFLFPTRMQDLSNNSINDCEVRDINYKVSKILDPRSFEAVTCFKEICVLNVIV